MPDGHNEGTRALGGQEQQCRNLSSQHEAVPGKPQQPHDSEHDSEPQKPSSSSFKMPAFIAYPIVTVQIFLQRRIITPSKS